MLGDLDVSRASYQMYSLWRVQMLLMFSIFAAVGVGGLVATSMSTRSGHPIWPFVVWLLILVWNGYWFLFRIAFRLDLFDSELRWRAPLHGGVIALADLVEMRPHRLGSSVEVLRLADGSKVLVMVRKGFVEFVSEVQRVAPHVQGRVGVLAKLGDRLPGPRGFRRQG